MSFWLLMSLVLSISFSGDLLSSYVNIKYELAIKTIHDIIYNPSISVIGDESQLRYILKLIIPNEYKSLLNRTNVMGINSLTNNKVVKNIMTGQSVIMCHSYLGEKLLILFDILNFKFTQDKYNKMHFGYLINKNHSHSQQIFKM